MAKPELNIATLKSIFEDEVLFYTDKLNETDVFVEYLNADGIPVFESISSQQFHAFISCRYRAEEDTLYPPAFKPILYGYVQDVIYRKQNPVSIHRRLDGSIRKGMIVYALANTERNTVIVKTSGWKIGRSNKIKFLRSSVEQAQVSPERGGDLLQLMRPFINLPDDEFKLLVIAIVQSFSRCSSHFVMLFSSGKGTGKSTLTQVIRCLIDPSESALMLTPTTESDLKTALANTYIACFDNTDTLSTKFSNILCAAVTGTKEVKRKLYSDADQVVLSLHNLLILNGIDIVPYKSDLSERSLYFSLLRIAPENRIPDSEFWDNFHAARPQIMGAIFNTLFKAMKLFPSVQTKKLHRMADAHKEMLAIALALGMTEAEFNRILDENKDRLENAYAQNNPFVTAISDFFESNGPITDQAASLYNKVRRFAGNVKDFPGSASIFTRRLEQERDALNRVGIDFTKIRDTGNGNRCKLAIHKKGATPSMSTKKNLRKNNATKVSSLLEDDETDDE